MKPEKPDKPRPDFPLFAHASGQWAKTIRGKHHYFGVWSDPQGALELYTAQKDDLYAGRQPSTGDGLTVVQLVNHFLTSKKRKVDAGELEARSFKDYHRQCAQILKVLGRNTHVLNLRPLDFEKLRAAYAKTHGPKTLEGDIARTRAVFNYSAKTFGIQVRYGDSFDKPSRATLRKHRQQQTPKMFEPAQLHKIIDEASVQLKAMILLGLNCGFGNRDCARLRMPHIDLNGKWINYPRPKTGIDRRCPLWRETVEALKDVLDTRPEPKSEEHTDLVFITRLRHPWIGGSNGGDDDPISKEFTKLLKGLELHRKGLGFYALRHVFQTIGDRTRDKDAVHAIMGHVEAASDMGAIYNQERVEDARLQAVTKHVHDWLYPRRTPSRRGRSVA